MVHELFILAMGKLSINLNVGRVFAWSYAYYWFVQNSKMAVDRSMKAAECSPLLANQSTCGTLSWYQKSLTDALSNGTLVVASSYFVLKF